MNNKIQLRKAGTLLYVFYMAVTLLHAQNVVKVQSGTVVSSTGGGVITLTNMDLNNDGTINQQAGQGTFVFNGSSTNSISGTAQPMFDILQIAKTGSTMLSLQQSVQINSGITFTSGLIDLNGQNILLQPTALLNGESETSRITGAGGGYVQIVNTLNAPSSVNPGNLGAVITSSQNLGSVTIRRGHTSQSNNYGGGNSIYRYYDIIPTNNSALNATLRINYFDAELNGLNENVLTMWASPDALHWTNHGFNTRTATGNYIEQTGINNLAWVTLTSATNSLPLIWGSFNTQCLTGQVRISWQTQQEQNTSSFTIRRSTNGSQWTNVGKVPATNNNSGSSYSYMDGQALAGGNYYQVIEEDLDGRQTYSPILTSQCALNESSKVYPNPVVNNCWVSISSDGNSTVTMKLYDNKGALLQQQTRSLQAGNNQLSLSLYGYAPGIYSLVITRDNRTINIIKLEKQ